MSLLSPTRDPSGPCTRGSCSGRADSVCTKGGTPLPLKWEPTVNLHALGSLGGGAVEPGVGREEEEHRGRGRSGGRREEAAREEGRGRRRGPGGGGDRFVYGQWGEGRGRRAEPGAGRGFAALLPAWDPAVALPSCSGAAHSSSFCLQRPSPTSSGSPGEAGCPDLLLQLADPGRRPVTQAP